MPHTSEKPAIAFDSDYLRATIPGWGVDLDPKDRPAVPMEQYVPRAAAGTGGALPELQRQTYPRERSTEHKMLTPVFGTVCPPKGLSGVVRRLAYRRYSEGQTAHWLLLVLADRIDVIEEIGAAALRGRPDNPFAEMGLAAELTGHPIRSRFGQHRADLKHQPVDILLFLGKGLVLGGVLVGAGVLVKQQLAGKRRRGLFR